MSTGIDRGVIMTVWTPSRESNDRTLSAYEKYPERFIQPRFILSVRS